MPSFKFSECTPARSVEAIEANIEAAQKKLDDLRVELDIRRSGSFRLLSSWVPFSDATRSMLTVSPKFDGAGDMCLTISEKGQRSADFFINRDGAHALVDHLARCLMRTD